MEKQVRLTICRHGAYNQKKSFPINNDVIGLTYSIGFHLQHKFGKIDCIYTSALERTIFTGSILAHGAQVRQENIFHDERLNEDAFVMEVQEFVEEIKLNAKQQGYSHILLVTHLPVFWRLGYPKNGLIKPSHSAIFSAPDWDSLIVEYPNSEKEISEQPPYVCSATQYFNKNIKEWQNLEDILSKMDEYFDKHYRKR